MGLPINKFICASNKNNVLTDFINTGVYDKNRQFYATASPSMDILVSSNLERLLYMFSDCDDKLVATWMTQLKTTGKYEVTPEVKEKITSQFFGGYCDDDSTKATIKKLFEDEKYLCDTHTSVAINVYNQYVEKTGDKTPVVIASTASPYKFSHSVLEAVAPELICDDEFEMVERLNKVSGADVPKPIAELQNLDVRFKNVTEADKMPEYVKNTLGI